MIYVVGDPCTMDQACMDECPVDAIYAGNRQVFIHPTECIGCGACVNVCPSAAIKPAGSLPPDWEPYKEAAAEIFRELGPTEGGSTRTEPVPDPPGHVGEH